MGVRREILQSSPCLLLAAHAAGRRKRAPRKNMEGPRLTREVKETRSWVSLGKARANIRYLHTGRANIRYYTWDGGLRAAHLPMDLGATSCSFARARKRKNRNEEEKPHAGRRRPREQHKRNHIAVTHRKARSIPPISWSLPSRVKKRPASTTGGHIIHLSNRRESDNAYIRYFTW